MAFLNCDCKCNCTPLAFIAALIIGVVAAFLQITAVITVTPAFLWVLFGVAVGFLAIGVLAGCSNRCDNGCGCNALSTLLIGALGTALVAVILLGVTFAATSVVGAIFTGLLLFFFALLLGNAACLIRARCAD